MVQHAAQAEPGAGHPGSVRGGRLRLHTQLRGEQGQYIRQLKIFPHPLLQVCEGPGSGEAQELECSELCPCRTLQARARADRYIFSLAR